MIGSRYWSTGILITPHGPDFAPGSEWAVSLDFWDNGFCKGASSEGTLRIRYVVDRAGLPASLRTLKDDAERLGIVWADAVHGPTVYVEADGEHEDGDRPHERALANELARSLGWDPCYAREEVSRVG